ncbi:MAG TPA: GNAT family N-acetyltransferase [Xanthobacteraceae bacterium]
MSEPVVLVRPASAADIASVLALYAQPDLDDGDVLTLDQAVALFEHFGRYPDYTLYVAEQEREIVGTFALLVMDNLGHLGAPSGIVEDVVVAPARQSSGVGRTMMRFAMERCREKRCYKLVLSSNAKRTRAHAFYESLGFERHGFSFRIDLEQVPA